MDHLEDLFGGWFDDYKFVNCCKLPNAVVNYPWFYKNTLDDTLCIYVCHTSLVLKININACVILKQMYGWGEYCGTRFHGQRCTQFKYASTRSVLCIWWETATARRTMLEMCYHFHCKHVHEYIYGTRMATDTKPNNNFVYRCRAVRQKQRTKWKAEI